MATANSIIERAMRLTGNLGVGESLDDSEAQDGLEALNTMLDSWATENLFVYAMSLDSITLIPGTAAYTVGPTGGTVSDRPIVVDSSSYVVMDGISYPLVSLSLQEYNDLTLKTLDTTIPEALWYNPTFPNGTVTLYPVPKQAMTLKLWSQKVITSFASLTTDLSLPPGYKRAIELSLAEEFGPEFETEANRTLMRKAASARKNIKRINFKPTSLYMPGSVLSGGRFNIYSGQVQ